MISQRAQSLIFILLSMVFSGQVNAEEAGEEKLISIGETRLYINCKGMGSPVVVIDAGMGHSSREWLNVQSTLAKTSKTCIYDRAGYGRSDPGKTPRSSSRIAAELRTLLLHAEIPPPYLLVGHSFGGLNMRLFADLFPDESVGLVLVDAPHEDQVEDVFQSVVMQQIDPAGTLRHLWRPEVLSTISSELQSLSVLFGIDVKTFRTITDEAIAFQESADEVRKTHLDTGLPLTILMHGLRIFPAGAAGDQLEKRWMQSQQELVSRQTHGQLIIAEKSAHNIMIQQPELIVASVQEMIELP